MKRCIGQNSRGKPCRAKAEDGSDYCKQHNKPLVVEKKPKPKRQPKMGRPKPPTTTTYPSSRKQFHEVDDEPRALELARELVVALEEGVPFQGGKMTELFELIIGEPMTLDQTRAVVSYGINTAMKLVQNSQGSVYEWVEDWAARKSLSSELRHLSKWDDAPPPKKEAENIYVVRMPCPKNGCPMVKG